MALTPEAADARRNVSGSQVLLLVVGLVVLLIVLWFLFLRGGGEQPVAVTPTPTPTPTTAPQPEATEEPGEKPDKGPVETFEVFAPRDPFDPLVVASSGGAVGGTVGGTVGGGTGPGPTGPTAPGGGESVEGHRVRLIEIFEENGRLRAQIQVDGVIYTVDEGEVFADNFQVLELTRSCATLLFGDDQFTVCEGEEILK